MIDGLRGVAERENFVLLGEAARVGSLTRLSLISSPIEPDGRAGR